MTEQAGDGYVDFLLAQQAEEKEFPGLLDYTLGHTNCPYPHCDPDVLHAPGECVYCDHYPRAQQERMIAGTFFTGKGPDPATDRRPIGVIELWPGNRPTTQKDLDDLRQRWTELYAGLRAEPEVLDPPCDKYCPFCFIERLLRRFGIRLGGD